MYGLWLIFIVLPGVIGLGVVYGGIFWAANDAQARGVSPIIAGLLVGVFLPIGLPLWLLFRPKRLATTADDSSVGQPTLSSASAPTR